MGSNIRRYLAILASAIVLYGCGAEVSIRKGDQSFALGEYNQAAVHYKQAYSSLKSTDRELRAETAYKLGQSYYHICYAPKAIAAFRNAIRYNCNDSTVFRYIADMQLMDGKIKDAQDNYSKYLEYSPQDYLARNGLESCRLQAESKENPTRFTVKKDAVFNGRFSDWSPVFSSDSYDQIIFTSARKECSGTDVNPITGLKSCDLFQSTKDEKGKWQKPVRIEGGPNSEFEDGVCAFDPDFSTMYYTYGAWDATQPRSAQLMQSKRSNAAWSEGSPYSQNPDSTVNYAHPAVSPDGKWLYFVSDMEGGYGGQDIWRVPLDGSLVGAQNLGPQINTPGNEMFPTFRLDGDLYFSSNGHPGFGGLDIFCAHSLNDSTWTVTNMGSPVNSQADDFGMTFEGHRTRGFFSSNRGDARGRDHIYSFELPETVHMLTGWVYEKDGYELPNATVYLVGNDGTNIKIGLKEDGSFSERVTPGVSYVMLATNRGFMNYKQELQADSTSQDRQYVLQFPLSSISKPVLIDNIFYEFDRASLTPESSSALDELVQLLKDNPNVTIELGAHCDYKGNDDYNLRLSQQRAESVVSYLSSHGIEKARLTARGYGETTPKTVSGKQAEQYPFLKEDTVLTEEFILGLPDDQQEICNQLNRRTEFRVLRTTYGLF
ncbi:MAG: OmpA family protein [Bacteroidaceae bacterium]|nr:OmpA family protein [Bacteroidaceae bacterium]